MEFNSYLVDARLGNSEDALGATVVRALALNSLHNVKAFDNLAEHDVAAVEPGSGHSSDEELRAVRVGASVRHREETGAGVAHLEVLVGKLGTVNALAASTVASSEVTTLEHELGNDTVERRALVAEALLTGGESAEVGGSLGHNVVVELELDGAERRTVLSDVEENVAHDGGCSCKTTSNRGRKGHAAC